MKMPAKCSECKHIGNYTKGPFARNPHYCCELIWQLLYEDYRVDPEKLDKNCPLKNIELKNIKSKCLKREKIYENEEF